MKTKGGTRLPADTKIACRNNNRSEEHTSELQSRLHLVCRLLLEKKKTNHYSNINIRARHTFNHLSIHTVRDKLITTTIMAAQNINIIYTLADKPTDKTLILDRTH